MPELPEIETIRRDLLVLRGVSVTNIKGFDKRVLGNVTFRGLARRLRGARVKDVQRRGKALIVSFDANPWLLVAQPMMTGQLILCATPRPGPYTKIVFSLSNGKYLHYNDAQTFGKISLVKDTAEVKYFRIIGPEPFSRTFTPEYIASRLERRKGPIKPVLLDHTFVAGIGNIYASEILFACGIHPDRPACSLREEEIEALREATVRILKEAIRLRGTSMRDYRDGAGERGKYFDRIKVYGRENAACPQCRAPVVKTVMSGRSTFFCQHCQQ